MIRGTHLLWLLLVMLACAAGSDAAARSRRGRAARKEGRLADPTAARWRNRDRSAPCREHAWLRQRLDGVRVTPGMLVSVRGQVAGADPIVRLRGRRDDERYLVTREVAAALAELRQEVKQTFGPRHDIWLNGAYDSRGRLRRSSATRHASGQAVDLDLYLLGENGRRGHKVNERIDELAPLVARVFTRQLDAQGNPLRAYVLHEGNHVHVSLESPSIGGTFEEPEPEAPAAQPEPGRKPEPRKPRRPGHPVS